MFQPIGLQHDTQHNDTQHKYTQHNITQYNDTLYNDSQHNGTQNYNQKVTLTTLCITKFLIITKNVTLSKTTPA
jgi:hypothetical protein